jgi:hypothetical protein
MSGRFSVLLLTALFSLINTASAATSSVSSVLPTLPAPQAISPMILINQSTVQPTVAASLFIINSHLATLSHKNKKVTLTLQNVEPYITKFTVIPSRKASLSSTDEIIRNWSQSNSSTVNASPSAALTGLSISGKSLPNYIVELSNPVYDAKHATLSFKVKWADNAPLPKEDLTFTNVSLVVDDGLQVALNQKINGSKSSLFASIKS